MDPDSRINDWVFGLARRLGLATAVWDDFRATTTAVGFSRDERSTREVARCAAAQSEALSAEELQERFTRIGSAIAASNPKWHARIGVWMFALTYAFVGGYALILIPILFPVCLLLVALLRRSPRHLLARLVRLAQDGKCACGYQVDCSKDAARAPLAFRQRSCPECGQRFPLVPPYVV